MECIYTSQYAQLQIFTYIIYWFTQEEYII